ncbi:MAG TPA: Gldg family protein [Verrucomicrobiae bacterium]|nr:Gldg family protein [Verrucomicrobiae bacterium]
MPYKLQPSYSPQRRWKIGVDLAVRTILVGAVVVMANFLSAQFFHRFYLSSQTSVQLSSRTLSVLHALTNHIAVTLYYDRQDDFYPDVVALLKQYQAKNPNISFRTVDPVRNPGEAEKVKVQYKLASTDDKNLIIFDAGNGRFQVHPGDALLHYAAGGISKDKKIEFVPDKFRGEQMFTAALLAFENDRPFKAYFLQGDGEPSPADSGNFGYLKFTTVLEQNYIMVTNLVLTATRDVPPDCNLLIYIAPSPGVSAAPLNDSELQKINQYLAQGGRMLVLLNYSSIEHPTGLEPILQHWGVNAAADFVQDPQYTITGQDIKVRKFNRHPAINPIADNDLSLQMILPRMVGSMDWKNPPASAPQVTELAFSSADSVLAGDPSAPPRSYPLITAVEQKNNAGVANPTGGTRIIVTGDSIFLGNYYIQGAANREFLGYAANWLLDRPQLLEGVGERSVTEYRLEMTKLQRRNVFWLLLGALPGVVLLFGGVVWLTRRK